MALNETGQRPEVAEERPVTTETHAPTFLDNLRDFVNKHKLIVGIVAGIATPATVAGCAQEPQVVKMPEITANFGLGLQVLTARDEVSGENEMTGVKVFSDLNEPLTETSIDLLDQDGNIIHSGPYSGEVGRDEITFIDPAHAHGSEIAVEDGGLIRLVVIKGRDSNGNLVQAQRPVNSVAIDDTDPFPNE